MKKYLPVINETIASLTEADLSLPITEIGIDSLDLVVIRVALEKHFGYEIPDSIWFGFNDLASALNHFESATASNIPPKEIVSSKPFTESREHIISLPQMANSALSEHWLLKEMGDMHWKLLTEGIQQKPSQFIDESGNRLYATFARIRFSVSPLHSFHEDEQIKLTGSINSFGTNTYFSEINGNYQDKSCINANLMTTFTRREQEDNSRIFKGKIQVKSNNIQSLKNAPEFLNEYRLLKKGLLQDLPPFNFDCALSSNDESKIIYSINPFYDVNGVGLLYFASYPIICDTCFVEAMKLTIPDLAFKYDTIYRDTFYFANCNSSDKVVFKIDSLTDFDGDKLKLSSSLYRQSDNLLVAQVFTVKQKLSKSFSSANQ